MITKECTKELLALYEKLMYFTGDSIEYIELNTQYIKLRKSMPFKVYSDKELFSSYYVRNQYRC